MKYALFDEKGFPIAFYDPEIHSNIPKNAIQITDEQWMEFITNQGRRRWSFDKQEVEEFNSDDLLSLNELKQRKLQELTFATTSYIEQYYPEIKQRSDMADKEYFVSYLLAANSSYTSDEIYRKVVASAYRIFTNQATLDQELQLYPQEERYAWEQLMKIALRVQFIQAVKQEFHNYKQMIETAKSKKGLSAITFEFNTKYPL